ncbi:hypothetical protein DL769_005760 [Monosporascus sp. CRB-8-3]|nr:hypothetical protein DL769_005760 [Monosporascus sp. CRB-8-3]
METDQQSLVPANDTNAIPGLVGVSVLFVVALMAYGIRIYSRLCELVVFVSLLVAIHFGLGHYDHYLSPADHVNILKFVWALIVIQFAMAIGADIFQLLQCRPIRAMWEPVPDAQCWSAETSRSYSYIYAASDLAFAIMPAFFIWPMHRPIMERILVIVLMALGTVAAVAGAMKLVYAAVWDPRKTTLRDWTPLLWWYRVEEIGLIAAACAPFLKPLIERMLGRFGVPQFRFVTMVLKTIRSSPADKPKEVKESTTSMQNTTEERRLGPHKPDRMPSVVSSDCFDYRSDVLNSRGEVAHDQV